MKCELHALSVRTAALDLITAISHLPLSVTSWPSSQLDGFCHHLSIIVHEHSLNCAHWPKHNLCPSQCQCPCFTSVVEAWLGNNTLHANWSQRNAWVLTSSRLCQGPSTILVSETIFKSSLSSQVSNTHPHPAKVILVFLTHRKTETNYWRRSSSFHPPTLEPLHNDPQIQLFLSLPCRPTGTHLSLPPDVHQDHHQHLSLHLSVFLLLLPPISINLRPLPHCPLTLLSQSQPIRRVFQSDSVHSHMSPLQSGFLSPSLHQNCFNWGHQPPPCCKFKGRSSSFIPINLSVPTGTVTTGVSVETVSLGALFCCDFSSSSVDSLLFSICKC